MSGPSIRIVPMRVAVIDVGSNTVRLLIADVKADGEVVQVARERDYLRLGAEIERTGTLGAAKIAECAGVCAGYARLASDFEVDRATVIVTAPGRQGAAAATLIEALEDATALHIRVLTAESEGRLAYDGAVSRSTEPLPDVVAVVDVGGGSTEIAIGTPLLGAAWVRSADLGSLRLTRAKLHSDPPSSDEIDEARRHVTQAFAVIGSPPTPDLALAVGGSARAIAKIVGPTFGEKSLRRVIQEFSARPAAKVVRGTTIGTARAETMVAGALLLEAAVARLGRPLNLAAGGLREGAALALAHEAAAAAA